MADGVCLTKCVLCSCLPQAPKRISKDAVLEQMKTLDAEIGTYDKK